MTASTSFEPRSDYEKERNKPMPNEIHAAIQSKLIFLLTIAYGEKYLILSELSLATKSGSTPDISLYPKRKLTILELEAKKKEAPLTTIEILSPTQSPQQLMKKAYDLYFPMGVKSAWAIVPEMKAIQVLLPNGNNTVYTSGILKDPTNDVEIEVEKVFEDLE